MYECVVTALVPTLLIVITVILSAVSLNWNHNAIAGGTEKFFRKNFQQKFPGSALSVKGMHRLALRAR